MVHCLIDGKNKLKHSFFKLTFTFFFRTFTFLLLSKFMAMTYVVLYWCKHLYIMYIHTARLYVYISVTSNDYTCMCTYAFKSYLLLNFRHFARNYMSKILKWYSVLLKKRKLIQYKLMNFNNILTKIKL